VLDAWISDHITEVFGSYLGYNADETKRAGKADGYTCQRHSSSTHSLSGDGHGMSALNISIVLWESFGGNLPVAIARFSKNKLRSIAIIAIQKPQGSRC
jgi:hypothetical protein